MKKKFLTILLAVAVFGSVIAFSACENSDDGETIYTVETAYDKAKDYGYEGYLEGFTNLVGAYDAVIVNVELTAAGSLIIKYADGKTVNLGKIKGCDHDYTSWTTISEATCTTNGYDVRVCNNCGYTDYNVKKATGHTRGAETVIKEPTCTESGLNAYTCTECNTVISELTDPLGHDLVHHDGKTVCGENRWSEYDTCSRCDYTTYEQLPAQWHEFVDGECIHCGVVKGLHEGEAPEGTRYELGDFMYDFTVTDINGNELTLSALLDSKKMVVLSFWLVNDYWSEQLYPVLQKVYENYQDNIEIINLCGMYYNTQSYVDDLLSANPGYSCFDWVLNGNNVENLFNFSGYPTTVLIDCTGKICEIVAGYYKLDYWLDLFETYIN